MDQRNFRDRKFYERKFSYGFGAIKKYIYINYRNFQAFKTQPFPVFQLALGVILGVQA